MQPRGLAFLYQRFSSLLGDEACQFYKGRSQEKTHLLRLKFFLLLSTLDRARSDLLFRALRSVAGQCNPVVWLFSTSGFHRFLATKPVSSIKVEVKKKHISFG